MIRVSIMMDDHYEGHMAIFVSGHANEKVCAGVSALMLSCANAMKYAEKLYPKQIKVTFRRVFSGRNTR